MLNSKNNSILAITEKRFPFQEGVFLLLFIYLDILEADIPLF